MLSAKDLDISGKKVYTLSYYKLVDPELGDTRRDPDIPEYFDDENTEQFFIGILSTAERAQAVVEELSRQPGFRDDLKGFEVTEVVIDRIGWVEGFTPMVWVDDHFEPVD